MYRQIPLRYSNQVMNSIKAQRNRSSTVSESYIFENKIGSGSHSNVYKAIGNNQSQDQVAVKHYFNTWSCESLIANEIAILKRLDHPNCAKFLDLFVTFNNDCYLILEYIDGIDLFDKVKDEGNLSESISQAIIHQILSGAQYLHDCHIVHRDLKPENLIYDNHRYNSKLNGHDPKVLDEPHFTIKIIDFAYSTIDDGNGITGVYGSKGYMAPEVVEEKIYNKAIDCWTIGLITYFILSGQRLFNTNDYETLCNTPAILDSIFNETTWSLISPDIKDFIRQLLMVDPKERLTCQAALNHAWFNPKLQNYNALNNDNNSAHLDL
ncbi:Calcium/calmodulin-dependent protein kinase type 1B [Trichoplax sp. H2]|nr:Calcium/calmodulin-dependent protein kinase type 1B [Trichoplax sp. H2]|eukprot:RDD40219.1 Calcium/calmodulin-dependent protein kinase type 1B [Trichoplax sp. H2]